MQPNLANSSTGSYGFMLVQVLQSKWYWWITNLRKVQDHVLMLNFNTPAAGEHVGKVERRIWVTKERARGIVCPLHYPCLPQQKLIHLIHFVIVWLDNFPVVKGISADFSSWKLILWHHLTYECHCCAPVGVYCKTHKDNELATNLMRPWAVPAICLGLAENFQGSHHFLSLVSGLVIKRCTFDDLLAPQSVIDRVKTLAATSGVLSDLIYDNRHWVSFLWSTADPPGIDSTPIATSTDILSKMQGVLVDCGNITLPTPTPSHATQAPQEQDCKQLADEAVQNADLDTADFLPPPPEVITIDDKDNFPVTTILLTTSHLPIIPKIELNGPPPPIPPSPPTPVPTCYPTQFNWAPNIWMKIIRLLQLPKRSINLQPIHIALLGAQMWTLPLQMIIWLHMFVIM
jgi:hypothetical protein